MVIKGNKEGITLPIQTVTPLDAPYIAVFPSNTRNRIVIKEPTSESNRFLPFKVNHLFGYLCKREENQHCICIGYQKRGAMNMEKFSRNNLFDQELPCETMPWQTVTELIDNKRVLIENHRGIIAYNCEKIIIKLPGGHLCVTGCDLCISYMTRQQLIINGNILTIAITKGK